MVTLQLQKLDIPLGQRLLLQEVDWKEFEAILGIELVLIVEQNMIETSTLLLTSPDEGLRLISCGTRDEAYRPDVRPNRGGRKKSTVGLSVG